MSSLLSSEELQISNVAQDYCQTKLKERVLLICDEMKDLFTFKAEEDFDNPFVLSYLTNMSMNNCYV